MKTVFISILLLFATFWLNGQEIKKSAKIVDSETGTAIVGANIYVNGEPKTTSDIYGQFTVTVNDENDKIKITYIGYKPAVFVAKELPELIELEQSETQLNQIVVSADRDKKERTEVPAAISLLPPVVIDEVKPVEMSDLLNKISGVYMVELGNEQHSMSIRQPISYKSVFLYLEDGIPIRPTGVFNHNALIEIDMGSLRSIEVIRGAYSSLYGSEAIGGAINFITKAPSIVPVARISLQANSIGFKKVQLGLSNTYGKTGVAFNGDYALRRDGYRDHSDYDKLAFNTKLDYKFSNTTFLDNSLSFIKYNTDMTGGLDSAYFYGQDYTSQQTFTYRKVDALRFYSKLTKIWSPSSKTIVTGFFRDNSIKQNPHYRIKDDYKPWTGKGDKNLAHSEINDNSFYSIGTIIHHKTGFDFLNTKISGGLSIDYSPNTYVANYIRVHKTDDKIYDSYEETDSVLTDYEVYLLNTGAYLQAEISPVDKLKLVAALRYDKFSYDYRNHLTSDAYSGAPDSKDDFDAVTPKAGLTYEFSKNTGMYANYSYGFSPPQISELYRGVKVPVLEPSEYVNYETGLWATLLDGKLSIDLAYYYLKGTNEIITVRLDDGSRVNKNAGSTDHKGLEYNVMANMSKCLSLRFSGAFSSHKFVDFVESGKDYSGNEMPGAPKIIANSEIKYKPAFLKGFSAGLEWQHLDKYYMDPENTAEYEGFDLFNLRLRYKIKKMDLWFHIMNLTDELYATTASKSRWGVSYRPGNPRNYNFGIAYTFK